MTHVWRVWTEHGREPKFVLRFTQQALINLWSSAMSNVKHENAMAPKVLSSVFTLMFPFRSTNNSGKVRVSVENFYNLFLTFPRSHRVESRVKVVNDLCPA